VADVRTREGTWTFDDEILRIVPSRNRRAHKLRQALGEREVPLAAIAGIAFEPSRKGGRLRLRLRDGSDPFQHVVGGKLGDDADPYGLTVERDAAGAAGFLVDEVRHELRLHDVPATASDRFLLPSPAVPLTATAGDGTASFDGRRVRIEWTEWAEEAKTAVGPQELPLDEISGVEWVPIVGFTNGFVRFLGGKGSDLPPKRDPRCITWGMLREGGTMSLLAAAVVARLPHPHAEDAEPVALEPAAPDSDGDEHDRVLRRIRELGELHRDGVLDDEEFAVAKQALLRRL
jgi:hypothetical protein